MAVSRGDVESFIRMVHAYYANTADKQHQDSIGCDITHILSRKLDREARRLKKGLEYLGLPGTRKYTAQLPVQTLTNHYHKASPFSSGPTSPTMMASSTMSLYSLNGQKNDWKVGNASTIYQYEQTIEEIKSKHIKEMDQLKKENLILLKEIKSKDSQIQDMREAHQYQLSDLHKQLGLARMDFEKREISLKQEYQSLLDLEKAKYTRRLSHSHERLDAKDKDLAELSFNLMQKQAQSEPNSPTEVESLKKAITDQDAYQLVIKELQQKLKNTHAYYSLSLNELKEKQIETQARIDNLIAEQQQHVSEITDCLENEKHVLQIEHQAVLHGQTQKINEISQEIHALENKVQHLEKIRAEVNKKYMFIY
ncbi:uncharacterized protein B0P05DRAFT_130970 [Gilbertella persicaria]|uniref:uncharacterized protein n=1 Tax=Gilbertella persicaria TaxID=101096 RepID=UPI00221E5332|nr:uncharacterized protein B0P05DRAFT_130970 [Gilbertella persicaria]KAI8077396.1 hypothetical protein B0P05DRAFT_130970 [Gilbertella persicaria]